MSRVVERDGGQLLPDVQDRRAKRNGWIAYLCTDADQRATQPVYAAIARDELVILHDAASASVHPETEPK